MFFFYYNMDLNVIIPLFIYLPIINAGLLISFSIFLVLVWNLLIEKFNKTIVLALY